MHPCKIPDWAIARGRGYNCFDTIDPARTALVVIDMQSVFVAEDEVFGNCNARAIVPQVNRLVRSMRDAGTHVIWTRQTVGKAPHLAMPEWQYDMTDPVVQRAVESMAVDAPAHELFPEMAVGADDFVLDKYRYGAFSCPGGALAKVLELCGVDTLVLAGTLTNVCVESTAREGNMRGYKVIVVSDACATVTDEEHLAALLNLRLNFADVKTADEVLTLV
ncbi:cysteine hydrolase [Novosphingobium album (ex Hu et al. 2023)]|uniref:Cysteine hydrolase n=1 Tax=Novosphingobium album (ex Hu et al. 2023) TaxID=2930093 RepID=A0ABT0B317_9SPHN|nr:cysteine hydrolase [Novosphingobium album (ex Hu et al. 2023)]MCJ2179451.1 cysteine hydrolase [Novosphingobium album (ex Hu et al. 2023)]